MFKHNRQVNSNLQGVQTERPTTTPVFHGRPITLRDKDYKLKTTNLGVFIEDPSGIRTHRNIDNADIFENKDSDYTLYKKSAFAPINLAQNLLKIQSLENFFKNESLSFSTSNKEFKKFNDYDEARPKTVKSNVPFMTNKMLSMPISVIKKESDKDKDRRRMVFNKQRQ
jgi:hypothetical protein